MALSIRSATADDADEIAGLHRASILRGCIADYSKAQLKAWVGTLEPAVYLPIIDRAYVRVAKHEGAVAGFATTSVGSGLVNALYVAPFAMHEGLGTALLADAEEALLTAGQHEARLNATFNAVDFYRWLGYEDVGATSQRLPGGVALPCIAMRKALV